MKFKGHDLTSEFTAPRRMYTAVLNFEIGVIDVRCTNSNLVCVVLHGNMH